MSHRNGSIQSVHCVGRSRGKTGGSHGSKPDNPRHIIARFISRKDRDLVWSQRDEIKKTEHFSDAFFVPDLVKKYAEEGFTLRQALRKGCVQAEG